MELAEGRGRRSNFVSEPLQIIPGIFLDQMTRRTRLRAIRADLQARLDAGEFGPDMLYVCARGHEWLLWGMLVVLLGMANRIAGWPAEVRAQPHTRETAEYVASELERVSEMVKEGAQSGRSQWRRSTSEADLPRSAPVDALKNSVPVRHNFLSSPNRLDQEQVSHKNEPDSPVDNLSHIDSM